MDTKKLLKGIARTIGGLALIFLIGVTILQHQQIKKLEAYLDQELEMMISSMKMMALEYGYSYELEDGAGAQD